MVQRYYFILTFTYINELKDIFACLFAHLIVTLHAFYAKFKYKIMDKNTITGFVLIALVLIGFSWYSQPSAEEIAQMQETARQDSILQAQQAEAVKKAEEQKALELAMKAQDSTALFFEARNAQGEEVTIGNGHVNITLNTKGGSIQSASLTQYKNQQKEDVQLLRKGMNSLSYQ